MTDDSVIVSVDLDYGDDINKEPEQPTTSNSSQRNDKWSPQLNRSAKWSNSEIRILCQYLIENAMKMFGTKSPRGKASKKKQLHWMKVTHVVNSVSEQPRHWQQVRKKWNDLHYAVRHPSKKGGLDVEVIGEVQKAVDNIRTIHGESVTDDASSNASESAPQSPQRMEDAHEYNDYSREDNQSDHHISHDDSFTSENRSTHARRKRGRPERPVMMKLNNKPKKTNGLPLKRPRKLGNVLNSLQNELGFDEDMDEPIRAPSSSHGRNNDRLAIEREKVFIEREKLLVMQDQLAVNSEMLEVQKNISTSLKDISKCMKIYVRNSMEH